jgi:hypothetical protein
MNTSTEVKAEQGNLVILEKYGVTGQISYQAHAEGCADIARSITKGYEIAYEGKSFIECAFIYFSDIASDFLTDNDPKEVWNAAVVREFKTYSPVKACCKTQVNAEIAPLKNVEVGY